MAATLEELTKQVGDLVQVVGGAADRLKQIPVLEKQLEELKTAGANVEKLSAELSEIKAKQVEENANSAAFKSAWDGKGTVRDNDAPDIQKSLEIWKSAGRPYQSPVAPELMGVRAARCLRAFSAVGKNATLVPGHLRDKVKDKELAALVEKQLSTTGVGDGGAFLVDTLLASEFFPLLRDSLDVFQLGARVLNMPNGQLRIPGFKTGTSATWVGEKINGVAIKPQFTEIVFNSKKAAAFVAMSNDLGFEADYSIDMVVRDDLVAAMRNLVSYTAFHGSGSSKSPAGIDKDPRRTTYTWGGTYLNQTFPIKMRSAIKKTNTDLLSGKVGWVFDVDTEAVFLNMITSTGDFIYKEEMLERGTLLGHPYRTCNLLDQGARTVDPNDGAKYYRTVNIFFGRFDEFFVALTRDLQFAVSLETTFTDDDGTTGSAFMNDSRVVRVLQSMDMGLRQAASMGHCFDAWIPVL